MPSSPSRRWAAWGSSPWGYATSPGALVVPLTLSTMQAVAQAGFHRVQRLSTEWHANSFSGSTVRKVSRGMWALEGLNDTLLLELLPAFVVLVGTMLLLGLQWPVMGLVIGLGSLVYLGIVVTLATRIIAPAAAALERLGIPGSAAP